MDSGSLRSSRYEPALERAWHLSILTGQGVTACAVHSIEDGEPVALFWGAGQNLLSDPELPRDPLTVSFVSLPEWSTLVPDGALEPGSEPEHLALVHGGLPSGALRDEPVRSLGATCIYVHDDREEHAVLQRYPHARALPMQGLMVRVAKACGADKAALVLHRGADRLDVAIVDRGRLLLSNTYPARSAHDLLYFTLLALERTGISPSEVELQYGGTHLSDAERELLLRYVESGVPACTFTPEGITTGGGEQVYRWFGALEQFACVS
jgi:hypothetical protein